MLYIIIYIFFSILIARVHGDPHLTTFDGRDYDFQGRGDFTVMQIVPDGQTEPIVRMDAYFDERRNRDWGSATTSLGIALGTPEGAVHVCS